MAIIDSSVDKHTGTLFTFKDAALFIGMASMIVHLVYNRFDIQPKNLFVTLFLLVAVPALGSQVMLPHFDSIAMAVASSFLIYYTCLATSIVLYRLSPVHPLYKFPGPLLLRISNLTWLLAKGKHHTTVQHLHKKYGNYVRIGPNEISILEVDAVTSMTGSPGLPKGPMWDAHVAPDGLLPLITIHDQTEHARRRRVWNRAFSTASVKEYEPNLSTRALQLADTLRRLGSDNSAVDLAFAFSCFAFDFMGDIMFGGGFELMRDGDVDGIWEVMEKGLEAASQLHHVPWVMQIIWKLPFLTGGFQRFDRFCKERATIRYNAGSQVKDVFHHLSDDDNLEPVKPSLEQVMGDGGLAIVAGSDTTATALTVAFFYLLQDGQKYKRLQKEVDSYFPPNETEPFDSSKLAEMPYLNAVINEAMRLQPPVPSGTQRFIPKNSGGKVLGSHFVPSGTAVWLPFYPLMRDIRYFSPRPDEFIPERWLSESKGEYVNNQDAFMPFSTGPANCAGKNLAMVEMRTVVALLMQKYEMRFESGFDPKLWEDSLEDCLTIKRGKMPVVVTLRA